MLPISITLQKQNNSISKCNHEQTFKYRHDTTGHAQSTKLVVKDLVTLKLYHGVISDLNARRLPIKYTIVASYWITLITDQHPRLSVAKYIVVLQYSCANQSITLIKKWKMRSILIDQSINQLALQSITTKVFYIIVIINEWLAYNL